MTRLTVEHEAQIRAYPYKWHDGSLASHHVVALLAELDAVRAERDLALEGLDAPCPDCDALKQAETTLAAIRAFCQAGVQSMAKTGRMEALADVLALLDAAPSPEKG